MKNFTYTVLNAEIPVMYVVLDALIAVQYAVRRSVRRAL
jgi:hypothetical protein